MPTLDFGLGLAFELDTAELQPQVRFQDRAGRLGLREASRLLLALLITAFAGS